MERKIKVAINGLGRIGRAFLKIALERPEIEIVAGNDLGDIENIAYLLKYDSTYGVWNKEVTVNKEESYLEINDSVGGKKIKFFREPDPSKLPWKKLDIDIAVECTGVFETFEKASLHLKAGAKRAVISAPAKDDDLSLKLGATILPNIGEDKFSKVKITSNASCTTCAVAPVFSILAETIGIKKAILSSVHSYTASQGLVDGPGKKDWRRGRSGTQNIVPTTTGADEAVGAVIGSEEALKFFTGLAVRVPSSIVSLADFTFISKKETSVDEIKEILKDAAGQEKWKNIFRTEENPVVSSDFIKDIYMSIADLNFIQVVGGDLVKVLIWYDNEWGYSHGLVEHVIRAGKLI